MKTLLLKLLHLIFGIAVDTATESANTVKSTLKFWYYFSIVAAITCLLLLILIPILILL